MRGGFGLYVESGRVVQHFGEVDDEVLFHEKSLQTLILRVENQMHYLQSKIGRDRVLIDQMQVCQFLIHHHFYHRIFTLHSLHQKHSQIITVQQIFLLLLLHQS